MKFGKIETPINKSATKKNGIVIIGVIGVVSAVGLAVRKKYYNKSEETMTTVGFIKYKIGTLTNMVRQQLPFN